MDFETAFALASYQYLTDDVLVSRSMILVKRQERSWVT